MGIFRKMKKSTVEFVKSFALLLLALTLLVTAVLAWFKTGDMPTIEPFLLSINSEDLGLSFGNGELSESRVIYLPAATKNTDETISSSDLAKVLRVETFEVNASEKVSLTVKIENISEGLNYYIDTEYNSSTSTASSYAEIIKNSPTSCNTPMDFTYTDEDIVEDGESEDADAKYMHTFAVVFWADYTDDFSDNALPGNAADKSYNVEVTFGPQKDDETSETQESA